METMLRQGDESAARDHLKPSGSRWQDEVTCPTEWRSQLRGQRAEAAATGCQIPQTEMLGSLTLYSVFKSTFSVFRDIWHCADMQLALHSVRIIVLLCGNRRWSFNLSTEQLVKCSFPRKSWPLTTSFPGEFLCTNLPPSGVTSLFCLLGTAAWLNVALLPVHFIHCIY